MLRHSQSHESRVEDKMNEIFEKMLEDGKIEIDDLKDVKKDAIYQAAEDAVTNDEANDADFQYEMAMDRKMEEHHEREMEKRDTKKGKGD